MNKKGNFIDWFFVVVILFAIALAVLLMHIILNNAAISKLFTDNNVDSYVDKGRNAVRSFDNIFIFIIVGLSLFVLISSALVFNHPAMFFISFLLLCFVVTFAAIMANAFWDVSNNATFIEYRDAYPKMIMLMEHLAEYVAFMGITVMIAMFVGYRTL